MSPSEFDLRAFLREGEGQTPSADAIIARAEGIRRTRRVRFAQLAAAVVVTGLVGVGAVTLRGGTGGANTSAGGAAVESRYSAGGQTAGDATAGDARAGAAGGAYAPAATAPTAPSAAAAPAACPTSLPALTGPPNGGKALFARPVAGVTVCSYYPAAVGPHGFAIYEGARVSALVDALENGSASPPQEYCPLTRTAAGVALLILPRADDGTMLPSVVVTYEGCRWTATNGSVVRYGVKLPEFVPGAERPIGPISGSPAR